MVWQSSDQRRLVRGVNKQSLSKSIHQKYVDFFFFINDGKIRKWLWQKREMYWFISPGLTIAFLSALSCNRDLLLDKHSLNLSPVSRVAALNRRPTQTSVRLPFSPLICCFNVTVWINDALSFEEKPKITCSRFQSDKQHTRDSPAGVEAASTKRLWATAGCWLRTSRQSDCCWCHIFKGSQSASLWRDVQQSNISLGISL